MLASARSLWVRSKGLSEQASGGGGICLGALMMERIEMNQSVIFQTDTGKNLGFMSDD